VGHTALVSGGSLTAGASAPVLGARPLGIDAVTNRPASEHPTPDVPTVPPGSRDDGRLRWGDDRGMTTATWNGTVLAESDDIVTVEGNAYFPREAVRDDVLRPSDTHTICPWKGTASYYTVEVDGQTNRDAAWFYPEPKKGAEMVAGRVAFWRGVQIS
jgi:uncharacterized protein (DUF427 family)